MAEECLTGSLAHAVGHRLRERGLRIAAAESCTGGWLAKAVTDIAGSSAWFERGFVTYSNDAKLELLGVRAETLDRCGAVSEEIALEMATGSLNHSHADIAVAITGVAGPDGGTAEKPVGTVWLAWSRRDGVIRTAHYQFDGDRERVRCQSVSAALEGLIQFAG
jgi:nicotinamide-nucleotide amidase